VDDLNSTSDVESDATRYRTELFFSEVLPDRLGNLEEDAIVIIMQWLLERDVSGGAVDREIGYTHVSIPMEYKSRIYVKAFTVDKQGNGVIRTFFDGQAATIPEEDIFWRDWGAEDGELAWPERFPPHVVEAIKRDKGRLLTPGTISSGPRYAAGTSISETGGNLWASRNFLH
jgi:hypothetical protein